jgi:hypothetical protein
LLTVDSSWFFSPLLQDAWLYFGYFHHIPAHLLVFQDQYYATRLPLILPGWMAHTLFPPLVANAVLRMGLFYISIFSLYGVLQRAYGTTTALLVALLVAANPFFLEAMGNDYIDGFGITYSFAAIYFLYRSGDTSRWYWLLAGGGAIAALVFTNLFFAYFALGIVVCDRLLIRYPLSHFPRRASWCMLGFLSAACLLMLINVLLGGKALFFLSSVDAGVGLASMGFPHPGWSWLLDAAWLILPGIALAGGHLFLGLGKSHPQCSAGLWGLLVVYVVSLLLLERGNLGFIRYWYYADLLIPLTAIVLAAQLAPALQSLGPSKMRPLALLVMGTGLLSRWLPSQWAVLDDVRYFRLIIPVGLGGISILGLRSWRKANPIAEQPVYGSPLAPQPENGLRSNPLLIAACLVGLGLASAAGKPAFRYESVWTEVPSAIYDRVRAYEPIKADALCAIAGAHRFIRAHDPDSRMYFWYDVKEPAGLIYHQVILSYGSQRTFEHFPVIHPELMTLRNLGGLRRLHPPYKNPGDNEVTFGIFSQDPRTVVRAIELISALGGSCELAGDTWVSSGSIRFSIYILRIRF